MGLNYDDESFCGVVVRPILHLIKLCGFTNKHNEIRSEEALQSNLVQRKISPSEINNSNEIKIFQIVFIIITFIIFFASDFIFLARSRTNPDKLSI